MRCLLALAAVCAMVISGQPVAANQFLSGSRRQTLSLKTAPSGHTINVYETTGLNPNCSRTGAVTFRTIRSPLHGKLSIVSARVFPTYPSSNIRSVCNSRAVPGYRATYTSARGYVGRDTAEFQVLAGGRHGGY